jgi:hypothetical protein
MPRINADKILDLNFTPELFNKTSEEDLILFIDTVIEEKSGLLSGRLGTTIYNSTTAPTVAYVKRAELCLVAAELVQRRINIILNNVIGAGKEIDISHEGAQKKAYLDEAEYWISRLAAGITADTNSDFATGVLITSHFEENEE